MTTFSQIIDDAIQLTKRPDMLADFEILLNQTVREVHFRSDTGSALRFADNFREARLTAASDSLSWEIPNPTRFQGMAGVRYPTVQNRDGQVVWAEESVPSRAMDDKPYRYYRAGTRLFFFGFGAAGAYVDLAWFEFPSRLKYFAPASRPATYDDIDGWSYADGIDTPEEQLAAQERVSNWLLLRWHDVIIEGLMAKVYKRVGDDGRAKLAYSLFQTLRQGLWTSSI